MIGLQTRANPTVRHMRELIKQGYLGEVLSASIIGSGSPGGRSSKRLSDTPWTRPRARACCTCRSPTLSTPCCSHSTRTSSACRGRWSVAAPTIRMIGEQGSRSARRRGPDRLHWQAHVRRRGDEPFPWRIVACDQFPCGDQRQQRRPVAHKSRRLRGPGRVQAHGGASGRDASPDLRA